MITIGILKKLAAIALSCSLLITTGCREDDGSGYIFKYDISANPGTLDPQIANDTNAETLIANIYMGLLTANADGSLSAGVAEDWLVSDDGLEYTFRLRQDVYWTDAEGFEKQCTAQDFVFGFQRLFDPATKAPRAAEYYCIKNSRPINIGALSDKSLLGVSAASDFELVITLEQPNPRFANLLTEPPAMPCCEEYFLNAQGKYGLSAKCTPSNGSFYVKTWAYDPYTITDNNHLILRRNSKNSAARKVYPSGLNFFIEEDGDFAADFIGGTTSCVAVTDEQAALIDGDFGVVQFSSITTGLLFNRSFSLFRNEEFRQALALLADRDRICGVLPAYEKAQAIVPAQVSMLDRSYRSIAGGELTPDYDPEKSRKLYESVSEELDANSFEGARIIVHDESAAKAVGYIMQEWQREFGFYCIIETLSDESFRKRLESGDFEIAVLDLSGSYNSPAAYLECFSKKGGANYGKFSDSEFEALLEAAATAVDLAESAKLYAKAEQILIDKAAFVPLYYKNEFFFTEADSADITYNPFSKTVDFSQAKKF